MLLGCLVFGRVGGQEGIHRPNVRRRHLDEILPIRAKMHGFFLLTQSPVFALLKGVLFSKLCIPNCHWNSLNTIIIIAKNLGLSEDQMRDAPTPAYNQYQNKRNRATVIANKKIGFNNAGVEG